MKNSNHKTVQLIGCSVRGSEHEEEGRQCQDSLDHRQFPSGRFVIAVADGLGSASLSHEGSERATDEVTKALEDYLTTVEIIDRKSVEEAMEDAFNRARTAVFNEADQRGQSGELLTTLAAVVAGPSGIAGAAVGDCGIVCEYQDGSYPLLVPREMTVVDLPHSDATYSIQHDEWKNSYRFGYREEFDGVAVFSDGLEAFAWDGVDSARPEFFDPVFELVRDISDPDEAKEKLSEALNKKPFSKFSDDKTIVIGILPPDFEGVEGVTNHIKESQKFAEQLSSMSGFPALTKPAEDFESDKVKTASDEFLSLSRRVGSETQSSTFHIEGSSSEVVKIFSPEKRVGSELPEKIYAMITNPPEISTASEGSLSFAWPTNIVETSSGGHFLGYKMSLPEIKSPNNILEYAREYSQAGNEPSGGVVEVIFRAIGITDVDSRYKSAIGLARGVDALHQQGHAIGDLHHATIFVDGNHVILTDCNTFHISGENDSYEGDTAAPRYAPPEEPGETLEAVQRGDQFSLAIHIFQLMMNSQHPFQARGTEAIDGDFKDIIRENPFPYRDPQPDLLEPPMDSPSYADLPSELQNCFERCFIEGKTLPKIRPTAKTWVEVLEAAS